MTGRQRVIDLGERNWNKYKNLRVKPNVHRWLKKFSELNNKTTNETIYFLIAYYTKHKQNEKK